MGTVSFFRLHYNVNLTWMRGNFGLKLQNSPKLPHIHARLYCNANEKRAIEMQHADNCTSISFLAYIENSNYVKHCEFLV